SRWARLGGGAHLDEWFEFYPGLEIRRRLAMRIAFTNRPEGKAYVQALNQLYTADGFDVTDKALMNAFTAVLWLGDEHNAERMTILRELRAGMTPGEHSRLNSPKSARHRVEQELKARARGDAAAPERVSPLAMAKRRIAQLEHELAQAHAKLARKEDGSLFDLQNDTAADIVTTMVANITTHKAEAIGKGLIECAKRKQQRPAG